MKFIWSRACHRNTIKIKIKLIIKEQYQVNYWSLISSTLSCYMSGPTKPWASRFFWPCHMLAGVHWTLVTPISEYYWHQVTRCVQQWTLCMCEFMDGNVENVFYYHIYALHTTSQTLVELKLMMPQIYQIEND